MNDSGSGHTPSPFMRKVSLCLYLLGLAVLSTSGVMMVRWSLRYAGFGKLTVVGGLAAVVPLGIIVHTLINTFRQANKESNKPSHHTA
jgi:peptidoglycan/LPS O-acetylase OafA/YrhL